MISDDLLDLLYEYVTTKHNNAKSFCDTIRNPKVKNAFSKTMYEVLNHSSHKSS